MTVLSGKFQRKPIVVEAFQVTRDMQRLGGEQLMPEWARDRVEVLVGTRGSDGEAVAWLLILETNAGRMIGYLDYWVVKTAQGELALCDPDRFEETYVPVVAGDVP